MKLTIIFLIAVLIGSLGSYAFLQYKKKNEFLVYCEKAFATKKNVPGDFCSCLYDGVKDDFKNQNELSTKLYEKTFIDKVGQKAVECMGIKMTG